MQRDHANLNKIERKLKLNYEYQHKTIIEQHNNVIKELGNRALPH